MSLPTDQQLAAASTFTNPDLLAVLTLMRDEMQGSPPPSGEFAYVDGDVRAYGAVGDGETDDTAAIQAAFNAGGPVYLPKGNWRVTAPLTLGAYDQLVYGCGGASNIMHDHDGSCITDSATLPYSRMRARDFTISGPATSGGGIILNKPAYWCSFQNVYIHTGGDAWNLANGAFSNDWRGCQAGSHNGHGFVARGGTIGLLFTQCYAVEILATGKAGFVLPDGGTIIACNGLNKGEIWGIFGGTPADEGYTAYPSLTMIGCNVEDYRKVGLLFKASHRRVRLENVSFLPIGNADNEANPASYETSIECQYGLDVMQLDGCFYISRNSVRTAEAEIMAASDPKILTIGTQAWTYKRGDAGVIYPAANLTATDIAYGVVGVGVNALKVENST